MGARSLRTAASVGAVCGWFAGWVAHASDVEKPGAASSATETLASAASQLVVRIEDKWEFGLEGSVRHAGEVLYEGGEAKSPFLCSGALGEAAGTAVDDEKMAVRKLQLTRAAPSASASLFEGLAGGWHGPDQPKQEELSVTNARLKVLSGNDGAHLPTLHAKLSQPLPNGTVLDLPKYGQAAGISVEYDCWSEGRAVIELRMTVLGAGQRPAGEACVQWTKFCTMGWRNLEISHGDMVVFSNGVMNREWESSMNAESGGTYETATKFRLSADGIERLHRPRVDSHQKLLRVGLRGEFVSFQDGTEDDETFEVTSQPMTISVLYTCESDGPADVVMTLEKAVLSETHKPERIELKWRKLCGATTYRHLQAFLKGDGSRNSTQAVRNGTVMEGFRRPCPRSRGQNSLAAPIDGGSCETGELLFEAPARERRTTLELRVAKEAAEPPSLQPPPDLSYDRRIMQAALVQLPRSGTGGSKQSSSRKLLQTLSVKYTCFKEGESIVMVTLHVLAHKPLDLAWRKRCTEPKVHVGKALTAPQAIVVTIAVCSIVALICCLIFYFCGQDDRSFVDYDGVPMANGASPGGARDVELASRPLGPARLGKGEMDADDEVITYH